MRLWMLVDGRCLLYRRLCLWMVDAYCIDNYACGWSMPTALTTAIVGASDRCLVGGHLQVAF